MQTSGRDRERLQVQPLARYCAHGRSPNDDLRAPRECRRLGAGAAAEPIHPVSTTLIPSPYRFDRLCAIRVYLPESVMDIRQAIGPQGCCRLPSVMREPMNGLPKTHKTPHWRGSRERRRADSNCRIEVLQTSALPLGYGAH